MREEHDDEAMSAMLQTACRLTRMRTLEMLGVLLMSASASACAPDLPAGLELIVSPEITVCGGELRHLEQFRLALLDQLEQPEPEGFVLEVNVVTAEEFSALGICGPGAGGCAAEDGVWSIGHGPLLHEITHGLVLELAGRGLPALAEGIAESAGTTSPLWPEPTPRLSLSAYAGTGAYDLTGEELLSASLLTTELVNRFGGPAYLDAFAALGPASSVAEIDASFREHLGQSLDEVHDAFADPSQPRCLFALGYCGPTLGEPLAPPFEVEASLDCASEDTLGFELEGSMRPFRRFQMQVPQDASYRVEIEGASVSGMRCGTCDERFGPINFNGTAPPLEPVSLEAGLYVLEVDQLLDGYDSFRFALVPE